MIGMTGRGRKVSTGAGHSFLMLTGGLLCSQGIRNNLPFLTTCGAACRLCQYVASTLG